MRSKWMWAAACAVAISWMSVSAARAQDDELTDEAVQEAMQSAVEYIYGEMEPWGHWDIRAEEWDKTATGVNHRHVQYTGWTALMCYALLSAGEDWQADDRLYEALQFMPKHDTQGTYALGLRCHVWGKLPEKSMKVNFSQVMQKDIYKLTNGINDQGAYHYHMGAPKWDHSNTQYGALGVWEGAKRGASVTNQYWEKLREHFLDTQSPGGGWSYGDASGGGNTNIQMTSAGLAVMYITLDYLHAQDFKRPGVTNNHRVYKSILRGLEYMNNNYRPQTNGYNMVGVERVALASGWKYFNGEDWYRSAATEFLRTQRNGSIGGGKHGGAIVNTAFALIFLSRGRVPVFANKLAFDDFDWNNRPNDLANVTRWASDQFEQDMNWQVVGIGQGSAGEWLDAPILYFASHKPIDDLTDQQIAKIKRYIDLGGMLVVNADGGNRRFTESIEERFSELYGHDFKPVNRQDPIFDIVYHVPNTNVRSLHNGIRHQIVVLPDDAGWSWQVDNQRNAADWHLMANLFQYAVERSKPRPRLAEHHVEKTGAGGQVVHVGRAKYEGRWNPEPLSWERLDVFAANKGKATMVTHQLDLAALAGADVSMVHVAGTDAVSFTPEQIDAIKQYVAGGGVVLFEAAGGDTAFTRAVTDMLGKAYPDKRPRRLIASRPIISGAGIGGFDCTTVDYRMFYKQRLGSTSRPSLQAVMFDGEPRIILSAEDLTEGMLGQPVWGVFGYDSESASQLMTNIALWSAKTHPASGNVETDEPADDESGDEANAGGEPVAAEAP